MTPSAQIAGGRRNRRWTRDTIIEKITEWHARHGEAPGSADWNPSLARWRAQEWRVERYYDGSWPSTNAVKRAFDGSFDAAVRAAGLEPARPGPPRAAGTARPAAAPRHEVPAPRLPVSEADLVRRAEAAEARADRAEKRLAEARHRARLATERAGRARRTRDRAIADARARVAAALDQSDAAMRDADALRRASAPTGTEDGPAGPGVLAGALRRLASARATGDRQGLRRELGEVAAAALRWRDRL